MTQPRAWGVFLTRRAQRELDILAGQQGPRVRARLATLSAGLDLGKVRGDVRKIRGEEGTYRLRVAITECSLASTDPLAWWWCSESFIVARRMDRSKRLGESWPSAAYNRNHGA